jgi:hypothetical protein
MRFEVTKELTWTDGGKFSNPGYFEGAGALKPILMRMFAGGRGENSDLPCEVDIMGGVSYGSKVKLTITLEVEDARQ